MATVTNQVNAPAFNGENVLVTLNSADALSILPTLVAGRLATCSSSSKIGYVDNVDKLGNTFEVTPPTMVKRFDSSSTPGVLAAAETITLA
jgi:hypothetical protein